MTVKLTRFALPLILLLATTLAGCSGGTVEQALSPDPSTTQWQGDNPASNGDNVIAIPSNFPRELGYENAVLLAVSPSQTSPVTSPTISAASPVAAIQTWHLTRWRSSDPSQTVANFYTQVFQRQNWKLQPQTNSEEGQSKLIAQNDTKGLQVIVELKGTLTPGSNLLVTDFTVLYGPAGTTPPSDLALAIPTDRNSSLPNTADSPGSNPNTSPTGTPPNSSLLPTGSLPSDWATTPAPLQSYVQEVYRLGGLETSPNNAFNPNQSINRRSFARWLVQTNNRIFSTRPARQIRLATTGDTPIFRDVPATDPDFTYIQGLAAAGYIPSPLSGSPTQLQFRPDAPLTRETLLQWKVPVDVRQNLPTTTLDQVKQVWGFKDINRITPEALPAVMSDYQNGDQANIRRLYGATLLLQPQKPVTRAEAAAALWYIGYQNDGLSAQDALKALATPPATLPTTAASPNSTAMPSGTPNPAR